MTGLHLLSKRNPFEHRRICSDYTDACQDCLSVLSVYQHRTLSPYHSIQALLHHAGDLHHKILVIYWTLVHDGFAKRP